MIEIIITSYCVYVGIFAFFMLREHKKNMKEFEDAIS